tara:strand:- start:468 stop:1079 length:612 start_codon:yes stop_codon:yes gene_type:complete
MKELILIGAGGHCLSCIDVIELQNKYKIVGLIDKKSKNRKFKYKILGKDDDLKKIFKKHKIALVTLGHIEDFKKRIQTFKMIKKIGFKLPKVISPTAYVSPRAFIGEGTIVMHGAIINAGVKIGKNCIINTKSLIEHGVTVGDNCHLSTGSILNGNVRIDSNSFIGSHSVVKQGVKIGKKCFINANIFIDKDVKDNLKIYRKK